MRKMIKTITLRIFSAALLHCGTAVSDVRYHCSRLGSAFSDLQHFKTFPMYFIRFQYNDKGFRVRLFHSFLYKVHLFVITGTHNYLLLIHPVSAHSFQNGAAHSAACIDHLCDLLTMFCHDNGHLSRVNAVNHFVYHKGKQKINDHSIDDPIHITENNTAQQNDPHIR